MGADELTPEELARWHTPAYVLDLLPDSWGLSLRRSEIARRLQTGSLRAAAMRLNFGGRDTACVWVQPSVWEGWAFDALDGSADRFWQGASFQKFVRLRAGAEGFLQLFGVRLNPDDVAIMFQEAGVNVSPSSPPGLLATALREVPRTAPLAEAAARNVPKQSGKDDRPRLSDGDMERFSRAILEAFADRATETRAHDAIAAMFPEKAVPRDYFLSIFRAIRGPKNRGRPKS